MKIFKPYLASLITSKTINSGLEIILIVYSNFLQKIYNVAF